jgi:hypothetical protein
VAGGWTPAVSASDDQLEPPDQELLLFLIIP